MTYRRSSESGVESSRWRLANRDLLVECGVPGEVADSDRRWIYVLLHGDDELGTGWNCSWMTSQHAGRLLEQLLADEPNESGFDLFRCLRNRAQDS